MNEGTNLCDKRGAWFEALAHDTCPCPAITCIIVMFHPFVCHEDGVPYLIVLVSIGLNPHLLT